MLLDQSFAPNKAMEYKPFGSMRETVEPNFINNIQNLLPSNDDLYDIDHFLGLSAHGNSTNDGPCTSPERELKVDGSKINTMVQVNKEKACENFSVSPFQRTRMVFEECSICNFRRHNRSYQPQFLGGPFCGVLCNSLQGHHNFWNEPAVPLFYPPSCTPIPNPILPPLYHGPTSMDRTNPILSHNICYPHNMFTPMNFGATNYKVPFLPLSENFSDRKRSVKTNGMDSKNQFEIDIEKVVHGDDSRTTLMVKNIPNRYTSEMLLDTIDENHKGTYDFFYLPIDFKNKCNVGYAFINLTQPQHIIPFYKTFNDKKWGRFSSQKVASLTYARIQGKAALVSHFQNSSLMNEDKPYQPMLFYSDGPNAGEQEPFPMCTN
ncbi:protein MEI2-like 4 isoform X2 [Carex rostrata]